MPSQFEKEAHFEFYALDRENNFWTLRRPDSKKPVHWLSGEARYKQLNEPLTLGEILFTMGVMDF